MARGHWSPPCLRDRGSPPETPVRGVAPWTSGGLGAEIGPTILGPDRMGQGACVTLRRATWGLGPLPGACGKRRHRQEGSGPAAWAAGGQIPTGLGVGCLLECPVGVGEQSWDLGH